MQENEILMYAIYFNPKDHPKKYVVRPFAIKAGHPQPRAVCYIGPSLDEARQAIPVGATKLFKDYRDPVTLVESWM